MFTLAFFHPFGLVVAVRDVVDPHVIEDQIFGRGRVILLKTRVVLILFYSHPSLISR
jgi:hypothetical protein